MRMDRVDRQRLPGVFAEAFSDYAIDMSYMTARRLDARMVKNGVDWDVSIGAWDGDRMVGFTLVGIGPWGAGTAAFDAGTGIVRGYRGRGLARKMLDQALPSLRARGAGLFLLEVLQSNAAAVTAYRKAGFSRTRALRCFEVDAARLASAPSAVAAVTIRPVGRSAAATLAGEMDWQPSWENALPAIERIPDDLTVLGAFDGAGRCDAVVVYSPLFNWIMGLVVRRERRRRGLASALLRALADKRPRGVDRMKLLNVDASDAGMISFLDRAGFRHTVDQYEMARRIASS